MDKIKQFEINSDSFSIDHLRPAPLIIKQNNLWSDVNIVSNVQWNYSLEINSDQLTSVKEILQKSCTTQISEKELKFVQEFLEKDESLLKSCGFSTSKLPEIIENNLNLASYLLVKNIKSSDFFEFLDVFINIDVTSATTELIAMLNYQIKLPQEFNTYYVYYCISFCKNMKEKQAQLKLAKYISIFIKHLIKTKALILIQNEGLLLEIQAFCIEFERASEVNQLFKQIKIYNEQ